MNDILKFFFAFTFSLCVRVPWAWAGQAGFGRVSVRRALGLPSMSHLAGFGPMRSPFKPFSVQLENNHNKKSPRMS